MAVLKSSAHIRTNRHAKSFHALQHNTGCSKLHLERARVFLEGVRLFAREARRQWLGEQREAAQSAGRG